MTRSSSSLALMVVLCLAALVLPTLDADRLVPWLHGVALAQSAGDSEKEAFDEAKTLGTVEAWDAFLSNYPTGFHADLARAYVKKLTEGSPASASSPSSQTAPAVSANDDFPAPAGSWGGIVRDGPGQQYRKLDTLNEGERVTLMARSDVMEDGYPWFKISYRDGRTGYKWGGILCSTGAERPDLFKTCPVGQAQPTHSSQEPHPAKTKKSGCHQGQITVDGKCMSGNQAASYCGPGFHAQNGKCRPGYVAPQGPRPSTHGCAPGMAWSAEEGCHEDD